VNRYQLRRRDRVDGTILRDIFSHWCCPVCALVQEHRQIQAEAFLKGGKRENNQPVPPADPVAAAEQVLEEVQTVKPYIQFGMFKGEIVDHRRSDGELEFRVHWDRKHPDEDEWFPRADLVDEYIECVVECVWRRCDGAAAARKENHTTHSPAPPGTSERGGT